MHNWLKLNAGEYKYLLKPFWMGFVSKLKETESRRNHWFRIYDEYIEKIGLTDDYKELLQAMQKQAKANLDWINNPTGLHKANMQIAELEMKEITSGEKGKFSEFVAMVEKFLGFQINLKEISVERFYAYVEIMKKENNG